MPAFASFMRLYVSEWKIYKTMQSGFFTSHSRPSGEGSNQRPRPKLRTFGSPKRHDPGYHELDEYITKSQTVISDSRGMAISHNGSRNESDSRL
jgi:hypothetical protein